LRRRLRQHSNQLLPNLADALHAGTDSLSSASTGFETLTEGSKTLLAEQLELSLKTLETPAVALANDTCSVEMDDPRRADKVEPIINTDHSDEALPSVIDFSE
jgi:hypothetical protein